jgi:outer membrane lipoprotein-sorting protein
MMETLCPIRRARTGSRARTGAQDLPLPSTALVLAAVLFGSFSMTMAQVTKVPSEPSAGRATGPLSPPNLAGSVPRPETASPDKPEEPPTPAERVIEEAIEKIRKLQSVAADLLEEVEMLRQSFTIKGEYRKAPNHRIYLRLTVTGLPDTNGTTLQVCDGETMWDYQQVLESQVYQKKSIKPILERLNSPELDPLLREQAMAQMGFAGPETLLIGLRKVIKFDQKDEGELNGKKVWLLRGTWKTRQGLIGPDSRPVPQSGLLPPYIPCDATLYLGKDDGWPYKLILVGRKPSTVFDTRRIGPDGRRIGTKSSIEEIVPSRIVLVYSNVRLNPTIRVEEFAFQAPPTAQVDDSTELMVRGLDQAIQMQADRKKADATRKEGPLLDQPIDIPPPPSTPQP